MFEWKTFGKKFEGLASGTPKTLRQHYRVMTIFWTLDLIWFYSIENEILNKFTIRLLFDVFSIGNGVYGVCLDSVELLTDQIRLVAVLYSTVARIFVRFSLIFFVFFQYPQTVFVCVTVIRAVGPVSWCCSFLYFFCELRGRRKSWHFIAKQHSKLLKSSEQTFHIGLHRSANVYTVYSSPTTVNTTSQNQPIVPLTLIVFALEWIVWRICLLNWNSLRVNRISKTDNKNKLHIHLPMFG